MRQTKNPKVMRQCLDCGVSIMTVGGNYCRPGRLKRQTINVHTNNPYYQTQDNSQYKPKAGAWPECVDCGVHLVHTSTRCLPCQKNFEVAKADWQRRRELLEAQGNQPLKNLGIHDCLQPVADRHPECRGKYLRVREDQTLCWLCERHQLKIEEIRGYKRHEPG